MTLKNKLNIALTSWLGDIACITSGIFITLSLAPFNYWFLGIISCGLFYLCLGHWRNTIKITASDELNKKRLFWRCFLFGLGMFGSGVSWVFVSIYHFGLVSPILAFSLTSFFVIGLAVAFALLFILPFYLFKHIAISQSVIFFAVVWCLNEWVRGWILTGFPWLYAGYAHIDSPLAHWSPVLGIYGLGFITALTGGTITKLILKIRQKKIWQEKLFFLPIGIILSLWAFTIPLSTINWTTITTNKSGQVLQKSVSMIQPNIPQEYKWNPAYYDFITKRLTDLSQDVWSSDILLWPEASIPYFYNQGADFIKELDKKANNTNTALISGVLYDDMEKNTFYNSIVGLGNAQGLYFKQRLVPFGEYVPLEKNLRGLIAFFDLPTSIISAGKKNQHSLTTKDLTFASSICYEVVYPDLVARYAKDANVLITISNDAWFGKSIGPIQHFQMARMRALENGKYLLRGTNTGISGVISHKGKVIAQSKPFEANTLTSTIPVISGSTPFSRYGSWPIIILCFLYLTLIKLRVFLGLKPSKNITHH